MAVNLHGRRIDATVWLNLTGDVTY